MPPPSFTVQAPCDIGPGLATPPRNGARVPLWQRRAISRRFVSGKNRGTNPLARPLHLEVPALRRAVRELRPAAAAAAGHSAGTARRFFHGPGRGCSSPSRKCNHRSKLNSLCNRLLKIRHGSTVSRSHVSVLRATRRATLLYTFNAYRPRHCAYRHKRRGTRAEQRCFAPKSSSDSTARYETMTIARCPARVGDR
jgi:hypothetical protein